MGEGKDEKVTDSGGFVCRLVSTQPFVLRFHIQSRQRTAGLLYCTATATGGRRGRKKKRADFAMQFRGARPLRRADSFAGKEQGGFGDGGEECGDGYTAADTDAEIWRGHGDYGYEVDEEDVDY